ncbi:MAG: DUF1858 domain-containing protein [Eubacteriales bacterium]|nr:DUF1858 domain-containing protein [Eubacteriales bacterium]
MKITETMKISEILDMNEGLETVFKKYHLDCAGCSGAALETLVEAAEGHGVDLDELLKDLNEAI